MRSATKMMMLNRSGNSGGNRGKNNGGNRGVHNETEMGYGGMEMAYNGAQNGYERSEIKMGGNDYGGMEMGYDSPESRRRYRRYSDGRFRPRSEMTMGDEDEMDMHYPGPYPFPSPVYEARERNQNRNHQDRYSGRPRQEGARMNRIGFDMNSSRELSHDYREDASYNPRNEMDRRGGMMEMGRASGRSMTLDKETAEEWMKSLKNEDGSSGPHWTMDQTKQVMTKRGFDCDPIEWWAAMNAVYSDYAKVAKKHNVNNIDFYADLAKAWLYDTDAVDGKAAAYYHFIAKQEE